MLVSRRLLAIRCRSFLVPRREDDVQMADRGAGSGNRVVQEREIVEERLTGRGRLNFQASGQRAVTGRNFDLNLAEFGSLEPNERGFVLSAARSVVFNALLAVRVADGSWEQLLQGDLAGLDGRGSVFAVEGRDAALGERCERLEIHPTGPLWGAGNPPTGGPVLELETLVAARFPRESGLCVTACMHQERRSLRLRVQSLTCTPEERAVVLRFRLARGAFATTVLRELVANAADGSEDPGGGCGALD